MNVRIFVSHSASDSELGGGLCELLQAMIDGARVVCSSLPGHVPEGGADSLAAVKQELVNADVVIGLITPAGVQSGEVPFQLGAAWALGKRLLLLLAPSDSTTELYLPMGYAETLVLGPEALLELCGSISGRAGEPRELGQGAREALGRLFPDWPGLDRESSERPIAGTERESGTTQQLWPINADGQPTGQAPAQPVAEARAANAAERGPRPGLPSCSTSLQAGRAVSDCVFNREQGGGFADELDVPFGAFLASLGANWSVLRDLEDLDVWLEAADNVLGALGPDEQHVRCWYDVGFQLATLLNLAGRALESDSDTLDDKLSGLWLAAWEAFRDASAEAGIEQSAVEEVQGLLANLLGPQKGRDYANLARVQERLRAIAGSNDASGMAASA